MAALIVELRRYSTGDDNTEYGRGWNCAMEEAETIVRRATISTTPIDGEVVGRLGNVCATG
jgi:hypothetical protein